MKYTAPRVMNCHSAFEVIKGVKESPIPDNSLQQSAAAGYESDE